MISKAGNILLFLLILFFVSWGGEYLHGQSAREKFNENFQLTLNEKYVKVLPKWEELLKEKPEDPALNYMVGICYYHSPAQKKNGIPYLEKAITKTTRNYEPVYGNEKAPVDAFYYLGRLFHLNYQFDRAVEKYKEFREKASQDHPLYGRAEHHIDQCEVAREQVENPINIRIRNLGPVINSGYKDYGPVVSLDEETLFFTSKRLRKDSSNLGDKDPYKGEYYEDIYVSHRDASGNWQEPELVEFVTDGHEATSNIAPDGRTFYFYKSGENKGDLFKMRWNNGEWVGEAESISDKINSGAVEKHVTISADNKELYFSSDRGGEGGLDIFRARRQPNGEWGDPENLGPTINTPYSEDGPYIHPDGKTLYFSSKGHNSMGGYDIFFSEFRNGRWLEPQNIGYPINTPADDIYFVMSADGKRAYFSSRYEKGAIKGHEEVGTEGKHDIYLIEFPDKKEKTVMLANGRISSSDSEKDPSKVVVSVHDASTGEIIREMKPAPFNGKFHTTFSEEKDYEVRYKYKGTTFHRDRISSKGVSGFKEVTLNVDLDTVDLQKTLASEKSGRMEGNEGPVAETGKKGTGDQKGKENAGKDALEDHFDYNKTQLHTDKKSYQAFIEGLVKRIQKNDRVGLRIKGSASRVPTGLFPSNRHLAMERANEAKERILEELEQKGIGSGKVAFGHPSASVNGPEFQGNAEEKRDYYKEWQYVVVETVDDPSVMSNIEKEKDEGGKELLAADVPDVKADQGAGPPAGKPFIDKGLKDRSYDTAPKGTHTQNDQGPGYEQTQLADLSRTDFLTPPTNGFNEDLEPEQVTEDDPGEDHDGYKLCRGDGKLHIVDDTRHINPEQKEGRVGSA